MKIALIGYGKMGRLVEAKLLEKGHKVLTVVDPYCGGADKDGLLPSGALLYASIKDALNLKEAEVAIEFTKPDTAVDNILFLVREKIPVVTGTTGWYDRLPEIEKAVNAAGTALLWSSNFSLGVNLFLRIAAYSAKLIDPFEEYDVAGCETHHNKKADSPSGTAKALVERVLAEMTRKKKAVYQTLERKPQEDEIHFASIRLGSVPGTHSLLFDSAADTIELTHTARSREGFAAGAILAAQWLAAGDRRSGVFTVDDVLAGILQR